LPPIELSPEQQRVLDHAVRVVEAGPGSGKTRALVARFLQSASATLRGVALVSFTNAATEEVRRRTGSAPHLLRAPHFVGTIDAFLHRFIVTPSEVPRLGRLPRYCPSWDDLPSEISTIRLKAVPGPGIRLSCFRMEQLGDIVLSGLNLAWEEEQYYRQVEKAGNGDQLRTWAESRIRGLVQSGVYDANTARVKAFETLNGPEGDTVVDRLTRRFEEFLVDEAQDCDEAEMSIIRRLADHIRTVIVADPDQAIFEFRGSRPELFLRYRDEHEDGCCAQLSTNYRSSGSICQAVTALRAAGVAPIYADSKEKGAPVVILSGSSTEQRAKFLDALHQYGIPPTDAVVLAHKRSDAAETAGRSQPEGGSTAMGNRLAAACAVLSRPGSSPTDRLEAVKWMERMILLLVEWPDEALKVGNRDHQLAAIGRRPEWLRNAVAALVTGLQPVTGPDEFGTTARELLKRVLEPLPLPHRSLGDAVKKPTTEVWTRCKEPMSDTGMLPYDTVHGAKGSQFPAVLVALGNTLKKTGGWNVLEDWEQGRNTEPRRVLYVAASRAEKLLAFGAGPHTDRVAALLTRHNVPFETR